MRPVGLEKQSLSLGDSISKEYKALVQIFDRCFGGFILVAVLISFWTSLSGSSHWSTFFSLSVYVMTNLILSQISMRLENPFKFELFRTMLVNSFVVALVYVFADGPFSNFWPVHLIISLAASTCFSFWVKGRWASYAAILYMCFHLFICNYVLKTDHNLELKSFLLVSGVIIMSSALVVETITTLSLSLKRELQTKSQLLQSSRLSSLGEMAGGIAHEINSPLAAIKISAEQLEEIFNENKVLNQPNQEILQNIMCCSDKIAQIIKAMRAFSREGSLDPFDKIQLKTFIDQTLILCESRIKESGTRLLLNPIDENLTVEGRTVEISQVLFSLVNNALDAIDQAQERWIDISVRHSADWIQISVTDSGPALPSEVKEKLFQPFFSTKQIGHGTGLSLSSALGVARNHGGTLFFDSECLNTRFTLQIPCRQITPVPSLKESA